MTEEIFEGCAVAKVLSKPTLRRLGPQLRIALYLPLFLLPSLAGPKVGIVRASKRHSLGFAYAVNINKFCSGYL
jgi:hypothetical protein